MLCVPAARLLVLQTAVRVLPDPLTATALQPASATPASLKLTVPVGDVPLIVAVNVTLAPTVDGLAELAMVLDVDVGPGGGALPGALTCTVSADGVAEMTLIVNP